MQIRRRTEPERRASGLAFLVFILLCAGACDPKPCLKTPVSLLSIEWIPLDTVASDTFGILEFPGQSRTQMVLTGGLVQTDSSYRIRIPYKGANQSMVLTRLDSLNPRKITISTAPVLRYAGESCGFYEGFEKLQVSSDSGDFNKIQVLRQEGDSVQAIHLRVYE